MNTAVCRAILLASTVIGLTQADVALAQDSGDIIVTARRVEERLQDVPVSISVLNQQQLTNRNIVNGADLAISTPSLSVSNVLGTTTTTFSLRGFGSDIGTEPSVGVYFADVVSPRGASNSQPAGNGAGPGSFFDLANVQVLKGPQGTLFGRNSTGGAVLLVPQKPTGQFEGYVEGSYGNRDMKRVQAVLNLPLGDQARLRLGVDRLKRDGYMKNLTDIGPSAFNDVDYTAARASLVVDLTPDLENYTIASYSRSNTNGDQMHLFQANTGDPGAGFVAALAAGQLRRYGDTGLLTTANVFPNARVRSVQWQIINTTTLKASDSLTVKNLISYAELRNNMVNNFFGNAYDLGDIPPLGFPRGTFVTFQGNVSIPGGDTAQESTFTEEFRLEGNAFNNALNWQTGLYYEQAKPLGVSGSLNQNLVINCPPGTLTCAAPLPGQFIAPGVQLAGSGTATTTGFTTFENKGIYAQGTYAITDKLKLTGGLRYTWSKVTSDASLRNYFYLYNPAIRATPQNPLGSACTVGVQPACSVSLEQKSSKPTWTVGVDFKPTEDILTYAKWSRGFRAGSVSPSVPAAFQTFKPETVDAYEIGLKTTFRGAVRGTFNLAAFYNDLKDQQLQVSFEPKPTAVGVASTVGILNAGKSQIYGLEADASIQPFQGFSLDVNYAFLKSKIKSINIPAVNDPVYNLVSTSLVGDDLVFTPKHKLAVTGSYTLPLDESIGKILASATYTYTASQVNNYVRRDATGNLNDTSIVGSRQLLDLNLNWRGVAGTPIDIGLFANNVTNKKYYLYVLDLRGPGGSRQGQVGTPRMYGARLRYSF